MKEYLKSADVVLNEVSSSENGLTSSSAAERLAKNGKNKLVEKKGESLIVRFLKQYLCKDTAVFPYRQAKKAFLFDLCQERRRKEPKTQPEIYLIRHEMLTLHRH